jgi:hypothetical protein
MRELMADRSTCAVPGGVLVTASSRRCAWFEMRPDPDAGVRPMSGSTRTRGFVVEVASPDPRETACRCCCGGCSRWISDSPRERAVLGRNGSVRCASSRARAWADVDVPIRPWREGSLSGD